MRRENENETVRDSSGRLHFGTPPKEDRNHELTELRVERRFTYDELARRFGIDPTRAAKLVNRRAKKEEDYRERLKAVDLWPPRRGRRPKRKK